MGGWERNIDRREGRREVREGREGRVEGYRKARVRED